MEVDVTFMSHRGRDLDVSKPVWVYRNLNKRGRWYSLLQNGRVVGHTQKITLRDCVFRVRKGGLQRVLRTGKKNVHAFVVGMVHTPGPYGRPPFRAWYHPTVAGNFTVDVGTTMPLTKSNFARLDKDGLTVWGPEH